VENSIRHGLEPQLAGGHIAVQASMLDDSHLLLSVHDNGLGLPAPGQPPSAAPDPALACSRFANAWPAATAALPASI
jgi:LytS/YehU family sensor histidine kinase